MPGDRTINDVLNEFTDGQKAAVCTLIGLAVNDARADKKYKYEPINIMDLKNVFTVFNGFTKEQKTVVYALVGQAITDAQAEEKVKYESD